MRNGAKDRVTQIQNILITGITRDKFSSSFFFLLNLKRKAYKSFRSLSLPVLDRGEMYSMHYTFILFAFFFSLLYTGITYKWCNAYD